jgi:hypothetical protein
MSAIAKRVERTPLEKPQRRADQLRVKPLGKKRTLRGRVSAIADVSLPGKRQVSLLRGWWRAGAITSKQRVEKAGWLGLELSGADGK